MDGTATIGAEKLTALICANSNIARAIREQAPTKAPAELSLLALVHVDAQGNPPADLAAVTFPLAEMVHAGAGRLIRLIKGETLEMQKQLYAPQYNVGPTFEERVS
jgi:DNA-binding LacI/PurR family transcriptional regulator